MDPTAPASASRTSLPTVPKGAPSSSGQFAAAAEALAQACRRLGLAAPAFRSPPSRKGETRTLRRVPGGAAVVAVAIAGRSPSEVLGDLVEGVIVANRLDGEAAGRARRRLWEAVATTQAA
jgi:hypothetical protein